MVLWSALGVEEGAQLPESRVAVAVGESAQAGRMPRPRGDQPAMFRVSRERVRYHRASSLGVTASGLDRGGDQRSRAGRDIRPGEAARLRRQLQGLVPAAGVEVRPAKRGERAAAGGASRWVIPAAAQQVDR